jgi:hypothetical protein
VLPILSTAELRSCQQFLLLALQYEQAGSSAEESLSLVACNPPQSALTYLRIADGRDWRRATTGMKIEEQLQLVERMSKVVVMKVAA